QVVQLGATHTATPLHDDLADRGAVGLEDALDTLAIGDLADRERRVEAAIAAGDHDAFVRLHTLAVALDDLHLHDHRVTRLEVGDLAGHAPAFMFLDDLAHVRSSSIEVPAARAARNSFNNRL